MEAITQALSELPSQCTWDFVAYFWGRLLARFESGAVYELTRACSEADSAHQGLLEVAFHHSMFTRNTFVHLCGCSCALQCLKFQGNLPFEA